VATKTFRGENRAALGLDDEATVGLATDRPRPDALLQVGAGTIGRGGQPGEVATGMEEAAPREDEPAVVRVRADLLADPLARDDRGLDAHGREALTLVLEPGDVRWCIRQFDVTDLAEVAGDRLFGDEPLDGLVAIERLAIEGAAGVGAVALDQLGRPPFVAGVDDPAVARGSAPPERLRLKHGDRDAASRQFAGRVDPGISAADDDDVRAVRQVAPGPIGQRWHGCAPQRAPLEVAVRCRVR